MNELILDMLELSKYEVKAVRLKLETFPLMELIQSLVASFTGQMENKGIKLQLSVPGENEVYVKADPKRMEQVILNMLSNAVRHADDNGIISIQVQPSNNSQVTVTIENTGRHITDEDLSLIWDHFYRAERARDRKSGGTGLGLAIVKQILLLHSSNFGVMNTERGVAFYFTLNESKGEYV